MESGIYQILNLKNGKFYIGSTKNLKKRWSQHKSNLNCDRHVNIILQRAWYKYGKENFQYNIIEECEIKKLFEREQYYIDKLYPKYNIGEVGGGDNITNHPNREDIIRRMGLANKKNYERLSVEEKIAYSEKYMGEKNPNFGNRWTDEMKREASTRKKIYFENNTHYKTGKKHNEIFGEEKARKIKIRLSEIASSRTGHTNPFYGKHHSKETKRVLSEKRKGKYYGKQNIPFVIDNKEYKSLGEASKDLNIPITTIRWRLKSKNEKFKKYKYKI